MRCRTRTAGVTLAMLLLVAASPSGHAQDLKGSQDHPLLTRYPGSVIIRYDEADFDSLLVPLGPATDIDEYAASEGVEGRVTRLTYEMDTDHSTLEVLHSYRDALAKAGFEILYSCAMGECGNHLYFQNLERPFIIHQDHRYLAARGTPAEGRVWVSVRVYRTARHDPPVRAMVGIVEEGRLQEDLVTVDAAAMARALAETGHVAVYGIYFDTDRTEIKSDSEPTLREMVTLLERDPELEVFIVGHTDGTGSVDHNTSLSLRRAEAVAAALVARGIDPGRMAAKGVASFAPVASNRTEAGRARNRRVELVER